MPRYLVFDDGLGSLAPLTDLRASFDVRTGACTTLERIVAELGTDGALVVPQPLAATTRERHTMPVNPDLSGHPAVLALNGRAPLGITLAPSLVARAAILEAGTGHLIAGNIPGSHASSLARGASGVIRDVVTGTLDGGHLLSRPWHWRTFRDRALAHDLARLAAGPPSAHPPGVVVFGAHPLRIDPAARVCPCATLDLEKGPIVVAAHAVIRPGAVLVGPCFIGEHSTIADRAVMRPNTAVGPWCKVGGEVAGTIFQGFSNKSHDGYLGDSWVGEWVNLGAGTNNSNLLNTYGEVKARATPGGPEVPTGETFLGAIIGDHAKAAIGTRIMTGAVIHTGAMLATTGFTSGCVAPFAWRTDGGDSVWRLDRFMETARAMMGRRQTEASAAYSDRIRELHRAASAPAR
ncbi:MAG: hypothetical protein ACKVU4_09255 [Phycisphaerales bacterium]